MIFDKMLVQTQQAMRDEQHPLLKVDTGPGGDTGVLQPPPSNLLTPGWNVACSPKRSWLSRWPEFISACWMTLILLGITFLVFYALGMSAYRRQSLIVVKCNNTKPENNVYFHHITPKGSYLPFTLYSDYLSSMALEYPFLHFNVHFLVDDSTHDAYYPSKHLKIFKRYNQRYLNEEYPASMNERDKQELKMFQQRYGNVNITIMTLSRYMSMTPLRCKWKMIPSYYVPFYARIFAVWEYGGIGLDLTSLNIQFKNNQMPDQRITAILRQHNDGIEEKKYIETLNSINHDERTEFFNIFYNLMSNIFSKTDSLFDTPLIDYPVTPKSIAKLATLSRNYRNKRDINEVNLNKTVLNITNNTVISNNTKISDIKNFENIVTNATLDKSRENNNYSFPLLIKNSTFTGELLKKENKRNVSQIDSEVPHVVLFYDFSLLPEAVVGPPYSNPEAESNKLRSLEKINKSPYLLSITSDGSFVAATSRHHPFLGHLLSSSTSRTSPRFAIENTLSFQCPPFLRNDEYCDNIYILK